MSDTEDQIEYAIYHKGNQMQTSTYVRRPFEVEVVKVTTENIDEVAEWCSGEVKNKGASGDKYIKVPVHSPVSVRQGEAHLGDWVLWANRGFKCYTDKAFERAFMAADKPDAGLIDTTDMDSLVLSADVPQAQFIQDHI